MLEMKHQNYGPLRNTVICHNYICKGFETTETITYSQWNKTSHLSQIYVTCVISTGVISSINV